MRNTNDRYDAIGRSIAFITCRKTTRTNSLLIFNYCISHNIIRSCVMRNGFNVLSPHRYVSGTSPHKTSFCQTQSTFYRIRCTCVRHRRKQDIVVRAVWSGTWSKTEHLCTCRNHSSVLSARFRDVYPVSPHKT